MPNTKTRTWFDCPVSGMNRSSIFASFAPYSSQGPQSVESRQSNNHARLAGGRWSGGGAFFLSRDVTTFTRKNQHFVRFSGGGQVLTDGTHRIEGPTISIPSLEPLTHPSDAQLMADGTSAIAKIEPLNPSFDLSVFVGEMMREGIPSIPGSTMMEQTKRAKAAGSEYLNVEFGWLPLVRGVRDFAKTVENADKIIRQHQENANRVLQRRYNWPQLSDSRADACSHSMTPAVSFFTDGGRFQSVLQNKWLEAEFIFYLPIGGSMNDKIRRYGSYARKLLGIDLSPEVLWNLAPWSWAADWFGNMGDVLHNLSAFHQDGMVMRHAYIMCHTRKDTVDSGRYQNGPLHVRTRRQETKTRLPATPYGFGVSYEGLSLRQTAVVAALGLSRW